ncbi:MAG TPA: carboxypeptidase regulatory-like domain-containing protein [Candidatus Polarisedimenticolia bacterium]
MRAGRRAPSLLIILLLSAGIAPAAGTGSNRFAVGRRLGEAIDQLRSQGLEVIYSSDLVRPSMRILAEPLATTSPEILWELIAPHGLETRVGPDGTLLIVRQDLTAGPRGGIAGRIVTAGDRRAVAGATISMPGTEAGTVSTADGRFLVFGMTPGRCPVEVQSSDGRLHQRVDIILKPGEMTHVIIEMAATEAMVEGVVVTPTVYRFVGDQPEARYSLEGEQLERLAQLGADTHRAASRLPGAASGDRSARFHLRGGETGEVLVLLDGLEIEQSFHLKDFLAVSGVIDSRAIDRVELLTGGYPVEFGDRMSGVMDLISSNPDDPRHTSVGAGILNSRLMTEGRTGSGDKRWLVTGRGWYPNAVFEIVDVGGEDLNPYYYDLMGKFELHRDSGTVLSGHVLSARDLLNFEDARVGEKIRARYATDYAWINVKSPWSARLFSLTQFAYGKTQSTRAGNVLDSLRTAEVGDDRVANFLGIKQEWIFRASDRFFYKWGFDARRVHADYDYTSHADLTDPVFNPAPVVIDRQVRLQPSGSRFAAYASGNVRLGSSVTAELGVRWGRQTYADDQQLDPRLNLVFPAGRRGTFRASWGRFHQSQRIDELQVEDGVEDFLPAQLSEHRVVSFEHQSDAGLYLRTDLYWKSMSDLRPRYENLLNPIELLPEGEPDRIRLAPRRARARGVEIYLRKEASRGLDWWAGYTLSSAEDDIDGTWEARSWDQRHALDFGLGRRLRHGWQVDVSGVWHSGWPMTGVDASVVTDPNGMPVIQTAFEPRNAERYAPYHRLDARVSREARLERGTLRFVLDALNLYGRKNVCCVEKLAFTPTPGGSVRTERTEGHWLGRVLSLTIEWEF